MTLRRTPRAILPLVLTVAGCSFDGSGVVTGGQGGDETSAASSTDAGSDGTETGGEPTSTTAASTTTATPTSDPPTTEDPSTGSTSMTGGVCGDGVTDPDEQCDNGPMNADTAACKSDCSLQACGDGFLGPGEGCDDGNTVDDDACSATCTPASCGDGTVQPPEVCDDGNTDDTDLCTAACAPAACGDSITQPMADEMCDDGQGNGPGQACNAECKLNVCGDGDPGPGEACDDGNLEPTDACTATCTVAVCGDNIVQANVEACDDGNMINDDACTNACTAPVCGDGIVQSSLQEECDDQNNESDDACVACKHAVCGDGQVFSDNGPEKCDDANQDSGDACNNCQWNGKRAFVTKTEWNGNLGGVAGADQKCKDAANSAGLGMNWLAWITNGDDANSAPATRFPTKSPLPYVRTDGIKIADNWADLIDGSLDAPLTVFEDGSTSNNGFSVWTNTLPSGALKNTTDCGSWTFAGNQGQGERGDRSSVNATWTSQGGQNCDEINRLYCFEQ